MERERHTPSVNSTQFEPARGRKNVRITKCSTYALFPKNSEFSSLYLNLLIISFTKIIATCTAVENIFTLLVRILLTVQQDVGKDSSNLEVSSYHQKLTEMTQISAKNYRNDDFRKMFLIVLISPAYILKFTKKFQQETRRMFFSGDRQIGRVTKSSNYRDYDYKDFFARVYRVTDSIIKKVSSLSSPNCQNSY